jgi:hypothetical protein
MSDGPANGIKIPRPLSRELSFPNRNHLTPQNRALLLRSSANLYRSSNASPDQFDTMRSVYGRPSATVPIQSIAVPNLIQPPCPKSLVFGKLPG